MNAINPLTPRTHEITLLQGDDQAKLDALEAECQRLAPKQGKTGGASTLDEASDYAAAVEEREAFAEEAVARGVKVILRAVGRKTWREFVAKHPPREGNETDKSLGINDDDFPESLVPASIASPAFTSDTEREAFLDALSVAQFDALYNVAFALNRTTGADPKAKRL